MTLKGVATILNRLLAAGLVLGAIALSGCNAGNDTLLPEPECPAPVEPGEPVKGFLSLLIDTGSRPGSRADNANGWGDEYDPENGNDFENRIDPRKIYIAVYRRDGTLLGTVNSASGTPGVSLHQFTDNPTLYQVVFDVSAMDVFTGGDYTAAVFVNATPEGFVNNPADATFTADDLTNALPMFGFINWHMGTFEFDHTTPTLTGFPSIGTVEMLRSVAKIEVALTDDYERYPDAQYMTFDDSNKPRLSLAARMINRRGYMAPQSRYWLASGKGGIRDLTFTESFRENTSQRMGGRDVNVVFTTKSADGRKYYIYLPEASCASVGTDGEPLRLAVTVNVNKPATDATEAVNLNITGTLFPSIPYDPSTNRPAAGADYRSWQLTRNHIYRFTLTGYNPVEFSFDYAVTEFGNKIINVPDYE